MAGTLLSIVMVGALSHALLAPEVPFTGIAYWIDFGYHTAVPLATAAWWLVWGGRAVELRQLPLWMVWPVAYCGYALLRGGLDGSYPYFFLDIGTFGLLPVVRNIVLVTLAFALAGLGIIGIARFAKHLTRHENRA